MKQQSETESLQDIRLSDAQQAVYQGIQQLTAAEEANVALLYGVRERKNANLHQIN